MVQFERCRCSGCLHATPSPSSMGFLLRLIFVACGLHVTCAPSLGELLLRDFETGNANCKSIARFAKSSLQLPDDLTEGVAKLSSHNAERDLHNWASRQIWRKLLPEPYSFLINVDKDGDICPMRCSMCSTLMHLKFSKR